MNGQTIHGVIRGKTIELASSPNIADGMEVEVIIRAVKQIANSTVPTYNWTEHDDELFRRIEMERKQAVMRDIEQ